MIQSLRLLCFFSSLQLYSFDFGWQRYQKFFLFFISLSHVLEILILFHIVKEWLEKVMGERNNISRNLLRALCRL